MTFTVTYRGKDGALREERVEAASRAECVAECRRRGIAPKGIQEGRSGKSAASPRGVGGRSGKSAASPKSAPSRAGMVGSPRRGDRLGSGVLVAAIGVLLLLLTGGVWWWATTAREDARPPKVEKPAKHKAGKPKAAKEKPQPPKPEGRPVLAKVEEPKKPDEEVPKKDNGEYVDERGIRRTANGLRIRTGEPARTIKLGYEAHRRFKHMSDEHIAGILEIVPGRMVFGRMEFGKKFVEDFKASLDDKIEILDTDSDYDKQLKRDVIAAREELRAAMQRGEDVGKLLTEARNQLQELGRYREDLQKRFYEYRKEGTHSVEDLQDFVKAVNVMLGEHGVKPIKLSSLLLRNLRQQQQQGDSK